jgi:single-stranded-DNA-specific exonuclease
MQTDLLDLLLTKRGITTQEDRDKFLNPDYMRDTFDPYLLPDMHSAVDRILKAVKENERICVYSDYDCDGIPGAVIFSDFFGAIGYENVVFYIPDRHSDGYGLHLDALKTLHKDSVTLIITVDLGTTAIDEVKYAKTVGIDVIITDHHIPHEQIPEAYAFINPKRIESNDIRLKNCAEQELLLNVFKRLHKLHMLRKK